MTGTMSSGQIEAIVAGFERLYAGWTKETGIAAMRAQWDAFVAEPALPALTEGNLPSADTIAGAFIRDLEARIAELEATAATDGQGPTSTAAAAAEAAELRDALRLGRLLLAGHEVTL